MIQWTYGKSNSGGFDRFFLMEDGCLIRKSKPKTDDYFSGDVQFKFIKHFNADEQEFDVYKIVKGKVEDLELNDYPVETEAFKIYKEFSEQMGGFRKCMSLWDNT